MSKFLTRSIALLAVAVTLSATSSNVYAQLDMGIDLRGGLDVPIGDINDTHNLGFGVQGSFYVPFSPVAAAGLGVGYNWLQSDEKALAGTDQQGVPNEEVSGFDFSSLHITPELRLMVGTEAMPTFSAAIGAGLYRLSWSDMEITNFVDTDQSRTLKTDSINKFGINLAGRVVFPMAPKFKIGFEAMNHLIFMDNDSLNYFTFSLVLNIATGY